MSIRRRIASHGPLRAEDGLTLVEMLVSIMLLGVILAALGGVLASSLAAVSRTEREAEATSVAVQLIEELQSVHWDVVGLYEADIAGADASWSARVAGSNFEGLPLVTLPGPASEDARDERVPPPTRTVVRADATYEVDQYIVWVDKDGDGIDETKRFVTIASFTTPTGELRSVRAEAERIPTQNEAVGTDTGTRVLSLTFSPDPATLSADEDPVLRDRNESPITIRVRTNAGVVNARIRVVRLESGTALDDPAAETTVYETVVMDDLVEAVNGEFVVWEETLPVQWARFPTGEYTWTFFATDLDGNPVESSATMETIGGTVTGTPAPDGSSGTSGEPEASPAPPPEDPGSGPVEVVSITTPAQVCVSNATWALTSDVVVTVNARGVTSSDGRIDASYPYFTQKGNQNSVPDAVATNGAQYASGGNEGSVWQLTVSQGSTKKFKPGSTVEFTVTVSRPSDGQNVTVVSNAVPVRSNC